MLLTLVGAGAKAAAEPARAASTAIFIMVKLSVFEVILQRKVKRTSEKREELARFLLLGATSSFVNKNLEGRVLMVCPYFTMVEVAPKRWRHQPSKEAWKLQHKDFWYVDLPIEEHGHGKYRLSIISVLPYIVS